VDFFHLFANCCKKICLGQDSFDFLEQQRECLMSVGCVNVASVCSVRSQNQIQQYQLAVFLVSWRIAYKAGIWETLFTSVVVTCNTHVKLIGCQRKYYQTEEMRCFRALSTNNQSVLLKYLACLPAWWLRGIIKPWKTRNSLPHFKEPKCALIARTNWYPCSRGIVVSLWNQYFAMIKVKSTSLNLRVLVKSTFRCFWSEVNIFAVTSWSEINIEKKIFMVRRWLFNI